MKAIGAFIVCSMLCLQIANAEQCKRWGKLKNRDNSHSLYYNCEGKDVSVFYNRNRLSVINVREALLSGKSYYAKILEFENGKLAEVRAYFPPRHQMDVRRRYVCTYHPAYKMNVKKKKLCANVLERANNLITNLHLPQ